MHAYEVRYRVDGLYKVAVVYAATDAMAHHHVVDDLAGHEVKVLKVTKLAADAFPRVVNITKIDETTYSADIDLVGMAGIGGPIPVHVEVQTSKLCGHEMISVCGVKRQITEILENSHHRAALYRLVAKLHQGNQLSYPISLSCVPKE